MKVPHMLKRIATMSLLLAVGLFALAPAQAYAEGGAHINLTPSSSAFEIEPGTTAKGSLSVINEGDDSFNVSLSSAPYRVEGLNYDPQFTQLPGTVDASEWVNFTSKPSQTVESKKLAIIDYTVTIPEGTPPGGYYAVIFAETSPTESGAGVVAHNRVGDILYITVKGDVKSAGSASALMLPLFFTGTTAKIGAVVSNSGGLHFQSKVSTTVKNIFGVTTHTSNIERYVLPSTMREISSDWSPGTPIGIFHIEQTASVPEGIQTLDSQWVIVMQPWVIFALTAIIVSIIIVIARRKKAKS